MANLFNGADIFGAVTEIRYQSNPAAVQRNDYPGVNGVEKLAMGGRGSTISLVGELYGSTSYAIGTFVYNLMLLQANATPGVFYDEVHVLTINNAYIEAFRTTGPVMQSPSHGWTQPYECTIQSTTFPIS